MSIDITSVRDDTPGCGSVVHFNNAGSSLPPSPVLDAVIDYLNVEARIGGYEMADARADQLASVYDNAALLFGGHRNNWAFVESATRAWNAAFTALRFDKGDQILTTQAEYPSNMAGLLRAVEIQGAELVIVPDDASGQVDVDALESLLNDRTRLVSLTHVPTQGGLINPAEQVGSLLRDTPVLYQVDACQSAGQLPVNVDDIGCDILSFTGRKFLRGPRGTGMVWVGDAALAQMGNPAGVDMQGASWDQPMAISPHAGAGRFEPYEVFFAGKVGLAVALDYASRLGINEIAKRNHELSARLRTRLAALDRVSVHDKGSHKSAIVTFTVDQYHSSAVKTYLTNQQINVSVSAEGSARLDFPERNLTDVVRASVHYFNTIDEVQAFVQTIDELPVR